ncbi:MAG TPA: alanine--glyoxylate aminotransferase family protein [Pirellulales bacterium]|jgi:alanine-glyoxylate transaminase/serine-glyoxylate transaminase/serine-pyruvate transaminase|nr:alanine--glyoxylate aminotransferase family protein [Pirellulales bacterium]
MSDSPATGSAVPAAPLDAPSRILMGPGPSPVHPRVLAALASGTIGHLDPYYLALMSDMQRMLREVMRTRNEMTLAISGTGSAGMEAAVHNLVEPDDSVLICVAGVFGGRMAEVATRAGAKLTRIERPWGDVFSPDEIKAALGQSKPKVVGIVMAETSTGAAQPIAEIAKLVHEAGALLIVDAVTALGGMPVETDGWELDAVYSCSQKCLGCPPGLAPLSLSSRAMAKVRARRTPVRSWYLDVTLLSQYWGEQRVYHHTAPINMTYALYESLRMVLEEGLENRFARHRLNHAALSAGLAAMGIEQVVAEQYRLPMLAAAKIPDSIDDAAIRRQLLERFNIEIAGGLGALKGKAWRIGVMGHGSRRENVLLLLSALEQLLTEHGHRVSVAVAAAQNVYLRG